MKRIGVLAAVLICIAVCAGYWGADSDPIRHVFPGDSIQAALDAAAQDEIHKHVIVHSGTYRPERQCQALIWFNRKHNGITLQADGEVYLTAANPDLASEQAESFPAVVNHVVYFGDGITPSTVFRGFTITGANNFVTYEEGDDPVQPFIMSENMEREMFFYCDGGGIKIFGRSYPSIDRVTIQDCYSSPCGAGVSIEHRGANLNQSSVTLTNCVFRRNRVPATGSAVDLLWGSRAIIQNCLFVENLSNEPMDDRSKSLGYWKEEHGAGALTILPYSIARVSQCTFAGNRNGVDDSGLGSLYSRCIFWKNNAPGGWPKKSRYELDIVKESRAIQCAINGDIPDLNGTIDASKNVLQCADPQFDPDYVPTIVGFEQLGYRAPVEIVASKSSESK